MRRALAPITSTTTTVEDIDNIHLLDLLGPDEDMDDILEALTNTLTHRELQSLAAAISAPARKQKKKTSRRRSIAKKHANAYKRLRHVR